MSKHCIITGGSRGIGAETAKLAARDGYAVTLVALEADRAEAEAFAAQLKAEGARALVAVANVANEAEVTAAFDAAVAEFGPPTAVLNAAGLIRTSRVADLNYDDIALTFAVNVTGLMLCCREAVRHMSTAQGGPGGSIVNVSSMAATIGGRPGSTVYAASKGAVDVFTTGFAREVAREGIRVNTVRPGVVATKMTDNLESDPELKRVVEESIPLGRIGQPQEIAEVVRWLFSPAASLVTGAHVNAGGGGFNVAASM